MKKTLPLLMLIFLSSLTVFGQKEVLKLSPEYKLAKNRILSGHLHSNSTGHYMYFREHKGLRMGATFILEKYDPKFQLTFTKKFAAPKKNIYGSGMKYFKGKFAWMMYEKNKSDDYLQFFMTPIDLEGNAEEARKIARFKYERRKDFPRIKWKISVDTTKILFVAEKDRDEKDEKYEAYISVIDNDFNTIWEKKVRLPYSERRVQAGSWTVTENGEVFFVAKIYEDNKTKEAKKGKKRKQKPAYDMKLYKMDANSDKASAFELKLDDAFVKGVSLQVDRSNELACVGFFGDSKRGPTQGVFYLKLSSKDGTVLFANKRRFTPKELLSFGKRNTSKDRKSDDSGLDSSFKFHKILIQDNGEIFATAEENYSYTVTRTDANGNTSTTTYYVSNSIVVINIGADGKVRQVALIPKKQTMQTTLYEFYATLKTDDQVYFLYNDDIANLKRGITDPDKYKRVNSPRECVAVLATIEKDGEIKKRQLFTKKEAKTLLMPSKSSQINDHELFFFNTKPNLLGKNRFRFGTITVGK